MHRRIAYSSFFCKQDKTLKKLDSGRDAVIDKISQIARQGILRMQPRRHERQSAVCLFLSWTWNYIVSHSISYLDTTIRTYLRYSVLLTFSNLLI